MRTALRVRIRQSGLVVTVLAVMASATWRIDVARAHSLGYSSIDHFAELEIGPERIRVRYLLDYAEAAAAPELDLIDVNRNDEVTAEEREAYLDTKTATVVEGLRLEVDGEEVPLSVSWRRVAFPPGDEGHSTVRLTWELFATGLSFGAQSHFLVWNDANHEDRDGWKEIRFLGTGGIGIGSTSLRWNGPLGPDSEYPAEVLANPPTDTKAWCRFGVDLEPELPTNSSVTRAPRASPNPTARIERLPRLVMAFVLAIGALLAFANAWRRGPSEG